MALDEGPPPDGGQPTISIGNLQYIIHHVFLPPKLPQKDDSTPERGAALTKQVLQSLKRFEAKSGHGEANKATNSLVKMLENMIQSRTPEGGLLQSAVETQMGSMENSGISQPLSLQLTFLTQSHRYSCLPRHSPKFRPLHPS
jgi:hypothetical protein